MDGTVKMVEIGSIQNGHSDHAGARIWTRAWPRKQHETIRNVVFLKEKYNYIIDLCIKINFWGGQSRLKIHIEMQGR